MLDFNAGRYDLHSLVRQYLETPDAQRNSSHPVSRQELLRRHVESFLSFAVSHIENFTALDRERANIFRAWEGCFTNDPSQAILFGLAMRHYLLMRGDYTFPRNNLGHQVGRDSNLDTKSVGFGNPTYRQKFCGKVYQEGTRLLSWSLQVTKELSDVRAQLVFLIELSKLLTDKGEYKQAACYC
ncbi:hypothetical protein HYR99_18160 [Candidatus Poribacteria bacterium]|nr:hypothetical protein [Candidatus Poribacteria bacterium]